MPQATDTAAALLARIQLAAADLQKAAADLQELIDQPAEGARAEEYLSISELVARIPYGEQTIRNLMSQGEICEGVHYLQRVKHGRIVFIWSRMQAWMREGPNGNQAGHCVSR